MRRIVVAAVVVVLGSLVSVASPAQAASGPWAVLSAGDLHTCAMNTGKSLYCWGDNDRGQIGDGTAETRLSPKRIGTAGAWASVSAGGVHTCAITTGNSLYCWGYNATGQVGDSTTDERHSPKKIGTTGVWALVSAGDRNTCAITTGKSLYCWGENVWGTVGDGTTDERHSPVRIGAAGVWAVVSGGDTHTCAITTSSSLYCWGRNNDGQVGDGTTALAVLSPKKIGTSGAWAFASAGPRHTCAISTGKSLYCWGRNGHGQIGDGTQDQRLSPKRIGTAGAWARVSAGGDGGVYGHTCATTTGDSLYCWGSNDQGQIGDGTTTLRLSPKKIGTSGAWAGAQAGAVHSCAITTSKALYCWGRNYEGQVGDGTAVPMRTTPRNVA